MIYSPRGVPEGVARGHATRGNISHIPEGQVNNMLIFSVGEDS